MVATVLALGMTPEHVSRRGYKMIMAAGKMMDVSSASDAVNHSSLHLMALNALLRVSSRVPVKIWKILQSWYELLLRNL